MSYPHYNLYKNIFLLTTIVLLIIVPEKNLANHIINESSIFSLIPQQALAQQPSSSHIHLISDTHSTISNSTVTNMKSNQEKESKIIKASGHFANNQIKDGIVTWIQGGFWNLEIGKDDNNANNTNKQIMPASFNANFTMIKPDGSLSHNHYINNFTSSDTIFAGNDIMVMGVADIHSDKEKEFKQVPIMIHLMGKKVLGLTIDVNKTNGHFASSNEMFGTLISGIGLNSTKIDEKNMEMMS